ncbi:hypothetical protein BC567DRAFT_221993 [Phyllosticta citribraziliensis]
MEYVVWSHVCVGRINRRTAFSGDDCGGQQTRREDDNNNVGTTAARVGLVATVGKTARGWETVKHV